MAGRTLDDIIARTGPIEPHLAALADEVELPDFAIACSALRLGEVAPTLRAVLARAADGEALSPAQARLLQRGIFLLGGGRDTEAFSIFLRFLRRAEAPAVVGLAAHLPRLLSGMFDGDAAALLALATDATYADDVRFAATDAAAFLTFDGRITRDRMRTFLAGLATWQAEKDDDLWLVWADLIARLGFRDLAPLVEAAFVDGRISQAGLRRRQFEKDLAAAEAAPGDARPFEEASYIKDVLETLQNIVPYDDPWDHEAPVAAPDAPIAAHLAALGFGRRLPAIALRACVERFEEAAPRLRALLERAAIGKPLSEEESLRCFRGLYVLAAARDAAACPAFLRMLRRPEEETDALLGDAITASLPRLLISLFDGDAEALLGVVLTPKLDEYLRGSTLEAATFLAWEGRIDREELQRALHVFYDERLAKDEAYVWYVWMQAVALLDFGELVPKVEAAWKAGRIDRSIQEWSDFKMDLARARTAWDDAGRFEEARLGYADDVLAELAWTDHSAEQDDLPSAWTPPPDTPTINPFRNVGRNDPCPCGSGKKYKKCCLSAG